MEWTLGHADTDSRGNRRYFTLASSPTEQNPRVGIRFDKNSSTFKKAMLAMTRNTEIVAAQITGDFTLPADRNQKIVFLAGGVGITPFRSMIKYLLDTHQRRPITLIYAVKNAEDIIYKDIFDRAEQELGIKIIYMLTDSKNIPASWSGKVGRLDVNTIESIAPDIRNHLFYISGSRSMVDSFRVLLGRLNISKSNIKTDYFSGLA